MRNTKINYLYRDGNNYKNRNCEIVRGTITKDQIQTIIECLDGRQFFIPQQVGLPEARFSKITSCDHCWFELDEFGFEPVNKKETVNLSVEELVANFMNAKDNWDESLFVGYDEEEAEE